MLFYDYHFSLIFTIDDVTRRRRKGDDRDVRCGPRASIALSVLLLGKMISQCRIIVTEIRDKESQTRFRSRPILPMEPVDFASTMVGASSPATTRDHRILFGLRGSLSRSPKADTRLMITQSRQTDTTHSAGVSLSRNDGGARVLVSGSIAREQRTR